MSGEDFSSAAKQWEHFFQHQIRDVVLCEYHKAWLWRSSDHVASVWRKRDFRESTQVYCRLCNVLSETPYLTRSSHLVFELTERHHPTGNIERYPFATMSAGNHPGASRIFRIKFPGSECIRGQKPRIISPTHIDYNLLSGWLNKCRQHHKLTYCQPQAEYMPGLKMIDCRTKNVIHISEPGCDYVALSYVWGDAGAGSEFPQSYPPTIEDAIKVTIGMGFRYLWVDRYCIDQSNEEEKMSQILIMGRIYSQAQLCIIAAAGSGPNYGLPGIGHKARTPQLRVQLGDLELIEGYYPVSRLTESLWSSRGWTFQEGCLSRRRLIFTDEQAIFSCYEMCCQESLDSSEWEETNVECTDNLPNGLAYIMPDIWERETRSSRGLLQTLLEQYTMRRHSYDSDTINAVQGIFSILDARHCWGLPFERPPNRIEMTIALNWYCLHSKSGTISGFPSWSWASVKAYKMFSRASLTSSNLQIELSLANKTWLDADAYVQSHTSESDTNLGKLIRVTGYVSRPTFVDDEWIRQNFRKSNSDLFAILRRPGSGYWLYDVYEDVAGLSGRVLASNSLDVIVLLVSQDGDSSAGEYLILSPLGGHFRRIGIIRSSSISTRGDCTFTEADLKSKDDGFLQRTDDDFIARKVRRTIIIE